MLPLLRFTVKVNAVVPLSPSACVTLAIAKLPAVEATVGVIESKPQSRNTIPGRVFMTLDFRHPDPTARVEIELTTAGDEEGTLLPGRIWAAWRYVTPGRTAGLSYDGLTWCDDHWAWFPKPYRLRTI